MIGELHATFRFQSPQTAKLAWERVSKRCRNLSVNRWVIDPDDLTGEQAVTVLTETQDRDQFERARRLLSAGEEIPAPAHILSALRGKRQVLFEQGGGRRVVRNPTGNVVTEQGIDLGPLRRPQG